LIGGIVVAVLALNRRTGRSKGGRAARLASFRRAIVGADKRTIAAALGQPRATTGVGDYLRDDTWYYLLDPDDQTALVVSFAEGVARQTQVVGMPQRR
jgi:hypothetical protein